MTGCATMRIKVGVASALFVFAIGVSVAAAQTTSAWALPNFSDRLDVSVVNPGAQPMDALATVDIGQARRIAPEFPGTLAIVVEDEGGTQFLPSQTDAGTGNKSQGAFVFAVRLAPHERKKVSIYYSQTLRETLPWAKQVHAAHSYGYNHATAAIESELIGYRTYGGFFFDVQAHRKGEVGLFNSLIGFSRISAPPVAGQDVLHIGDTLGLGGLFLRAGGKVYRPPMNTPDYAHQTPKPGEPTYRVLATGPLRALVEARLPHWQIGNDEVALRAVYEIRESDEEVRCRFWIEPLRLSRSYDVGAGIRDLPQMRVGNGSGVMALDGVQESSVGRIALGLAYSPAEARRAGVLATPDGSNPIVMFHAKLDPGHTMSGGYAFAAAWQGSGWSDPLAHVRQVLRGEENDPIVQLVAHETTPQPGRLRSEPQ